MSDNFIGPVIPLNLITNASSNEDSTTNNETGNKNELFGPALPPGYKKRTMGPELPSNSSLLNGDDDDDCCIGPTPLPSSPEERSKILTELEHRKVSFQINAMKEEKSKKIERESWMLDLPENRLDKHGLGPRTFMKRTPAEKDTSLWTESPLDKKKQHAKPTPEDQTLTAVKKRDLDMQETVEQFNKKHKRGPSLLESHQKKKTKEKPDVPKERVPFDRESDLQTSGLSSLQKESIIKRAKDIDSRFSSGSQKFL